MTLFYSLQKLQIFPFACPARIAANRLAGSCWYCLKLASTLTFPSGVLGPVDNPPCNLQRPFFVVQLLKIYDKFFQV